MYNAYNRRVRWYVYGKSLYYLHKFLKICNYSKNAHFNWSIKELLYVFVTHPELTVGPQYKQQGLCVGEGGKSLHIPATSPAADKTVYFLV